MSPGPRLHAWRCPCFPQVLVYIATFSVFPRGAPSSVSRPHPSAFPTSVSPLSTDEPSLPASALLTEPPFVFSRVWGNFWFLASISHFSLPCLLLLWHCMAGSVTDSMLSKPRSHLCPSCNNRAAFVKLTCLPFWNLLLSWPSSSRSPGSASPQPVDVRPPALRLLLSARLTCAVFLWSILYYLDATGSQISLSGSDSSPEPHARLYIWLWDISTWIPHKHFNFSKTKVKNSSSSSFWPISALSKWYWRPCDLLNPELESTPHSSYITTNESINWVRPPNCIVWQSSFALSLLSPQT